MAPCHAGVPRAEGIAGHARQPFIQLTHGSDEYRLPKLAGPGTHRTSVTLAEEIAKKHALHRGYSAGATALGRIRSQIGSALSPSLRYRS